MKMKKTFLLSVCLVFIISMIPLSSPAFETIKCADGQEYTVYGFFRNNLGMFTQTQEQGGSGNQLATARTWFRTNADLKFSNQLKFWGVMQFVYEPWYTVEEGNPVSENGGPQQHSRDGWKTYSEFDDINDVLREAYFEWKPTGKTTFKIGRQIAQWGEALTDRIGDVIHPNDNRFAFAFSNLEDTRIPQYMIRGIHDIQNLNTTFEWIVNPLIVEGQYTVNRNAEFFNPNAGVMVGQRFALFGEDRNATLEGLPQAPIFIPNGDVREIYPDGASGTRYGFRTTTALAGSQFGVQYWHTQSYDPITSRGAITGAVPSFALGIPGPTFFIPMGDLTLIHPYMDYVGAFMNKQLPWPGVIRTEVSYSPNKPYNTFNVGTGEDGVVRRDSVKYLVAYDLTGYFYPQWHKTAPIDVTLEHVGEWVPNARDLQYIGGVYNTKIPSYNAGFNTRISTNWFYNLIATEVIFGYQTFSNSGIFMPAVKWMPPWQNDRFSAELKYIGIYGDSKYEGLGIFKTKDMVLLTTQLNF